MTSEVTRIAQSQSRSLDLLLGLLPLVLGLQLVIWISYLPNALRGQADFRNCYAAGTIVRTGQGRRLYDYDLQLQIENTVTTPTSVVLPYVHLPYEALFFAPLTFFSYRHAFMAFLSLNFAFLLIAYHLLAPRLWRERLIWTAFPLLLFVGFAPISAALLQGQDSILTLLLLSAALVSLDSKRDLIAGLYVGLSLYKFQLILPLVALFVIWRRWKILGGLITSGVVVMGLSAGLTGIGGLVQYALSVRNMSKTVSASTGVFYVMPVSSMSNIRAVILSIPHIPFMIATGAVAVLSVTVLVIAGRAGIRAKSQWQLALAVCTTTLVSYYIPMHDLSILLIPMAVVLSDATPRRLWAAAMMWISALFCFLGLSRFVAAPLIIFFAALAVASWKSSTATVKSSVPVM